MSCPMAGWVFLLHVESVIPAGQSRRSVMEDGVFVWWTKSMHWMVVVGCELLLKLQVEAEKIKQLQARQLALKQIEPE